MDYVLSLHGPLAQGAAVTLRLFAITLALAVPLGLVLALARTPAGIAKSRPGGRARRTESTRRTIGEK